MNASAGRSGPTRPADEQHGPVADDRYRLRSWQRLKRPVHFQEAFEQHRPQVGRYMVLWVRRAGDARLRLGVIASRKIGGAVVRNRARRRLREAWRLNRPLFSGTVDVVLVARYRINRASGAAVEQELRQLAARAGLCADMEERTT